MSDKTQVLHVNVEVAVLLGRSHMPMQQLLRMGRGAVIPPNSPLIFEIELVKIESGKPSAKPGVPKLKLKAAEKDNDQ